MVIQGHALGTACEPDTYSEFSGAMAPMSFVCEFFHGVLRIMDKKVNTLYQFTHAIWNCK
jgi:hypothetical protein